MLAVACPCLPLQQGLIVRLDGFLLWKRSAVLLHARRLWGSQSWWSTTGRKWKRFTCRLVHGTAPHLTSLAREVKRGLLADGLAWQRTAWRWKCPLSELPCRTGACLLMGAHRTCWLAMKGHGAFPVVGWLHPHCKEQAQVSVL